MSGQRLTITSGDQTWTFEPANSPVRIGRDAASEVAIEQEGISRLHAQVDWVDSGWTFRDVESTQGSFVDGERVTTQRIAGDTQITLARGQHALRLGLSTDAIVNDLDRTVAASPDATAVVGSAARPGGVLAAGAAAGATQVTGETIVVECAGTSHTFAPGRKYVIGRDAGVDVTSQNPNISRRHAVLDYRDGWHLDDLGSSGGTFLDGQRVKTTAISGTMAFVLGDADAGERLIVKASGTRQISAGQRLSRMGSGGKVGLVSGAVAVAALAFGVIAWLTIGGDDKPDFDELTRGVVNISVMDNTGTGAGGTGTIIDKEKGLILTNAHVAGWGEGEGLALQYGFSEMWLQDIDEITISVSPGLDRSAEAKFRAELVAVDGWLDLAVIQITETLSGKFVEAADMAELTEIKIGDPKDLSTGDEMFVMGFPGVAQNSAVTLTEGSLSAFFSDERAGDNRGWMQMDADIRGGNSGGLMADKNGRLVGVPSAADGGSIIRVGETAVSRARSIKYALPLIEAAQNGTEYVSPYITKLTGDELIPDVFFGDFVEDEVGVEYECSRNFITNPAVGSNALALQVDYLNLVADRHQDIWVVIQRDAIPADIQQAYQEAGIALPDGASEAALVGITTTEWEDRVPRADGCLTATMNLQEPLLQLVDYELSVHVGGNLKPLLTKPFTPTPES